MPDLDTIERILKTTVVYGLAFVFLTLLLFVLLWVFYKVSVHFVHFVGDLRTYVPLWLGSQVEMHRAVRSSCDTLTVSMGGMKEQINRATEGVEILVDRSGGRDRFCEMENCDSILGENFHRVSGRYICHECFDEMAAAQQRAQAAGMPPPPQAAPAPVPQLVANI